jgi:hypothetical protein
MRIAGLGDTAALNTIAARMFARHQAAVAHQLARVFESRKGAEKRLQGGNDCSDRFGCSGDGLIDRFLQPLNAFTGVIDFMHEIQQRCLKSG